MHRSTRTRRFSRTIGLVALVFLLVLVMIPFSNVAAEEGNIDDVERLVGVYVGITIHFPGGISGSFGGTMNGKHFDCETIPPNTLYCIGPFAYWVGPAYLHIYDQSTGEVIYSELVEVPPKNAEPEGPPPPPPPPQQGEFEVD